MSRRSLLITTGAGLLALGLVIPAKGAPVPDADHPYRGPYHGYYDTATQGVEALASQLGGVAILIAAYRLK